MKNNKRVTFGMVSQTSAQQSALDTSKFVKDYLEIFYRQKKQKDNLLGSFDSTGKYILKDPAILLALKDISKKFQSKEEDTVYLSSKLGEFVLNFKIVFEISTTFCNAYLYYFEIEHTLYEDIKHTTLLDSVLDVYSPKFKEEIYSLWKVYLEEDIYEKDDYLYNLLNAQKEEYLFQAELAEILAQLFLMRMLKVLENCGELGEKIKKEYNSKIEELLEQDPSLTQNYSKLKSILDDIILKNNALDEILKTPEGIAVISGYINPMKNVLEPPAIVTQTGKRVEDKLAEKKQVSAKSKSKGKIKSSSSKAKPVSTFDIGKVFANKKKDKKVENKKVILPIFKVKEKTPMRPANTKNLFDNAENPKQKQPEKPATDLNKDPNKLFNQHNVAAKLYSSLQNKNSLDNNKGRSI